jgi:hypothetical protein
MCTPIMVIMFNMMVKGGGAPKSEKVFLNRKHMIFLTHLYF